MKRYLSLIMCFVSFTSVAQNNLVLVTIDGLRWQDVFRGPQIEIANDKTYTKTKTGLMKRLLTQPPKQARKTLMPFLWTDIAEQGVIIGNRDIGSNMSVANQWNFSYPGYSEIFTGVTNPKLNSNKKINNPEVSFLEWLQNEKGYKHVAVFGSWDVFPYIFNVERSKLHVNAGFNNAFGYLLTNKAKYLNQIQAQTPSPWTTVRLDTFTHNFALEYLKTNKPKVITISYGETDDFAHDGRYDHYIEAAHRTDQFIAKLWAQLQSMPEYKNKTNLLIVTDHGRGSNLNDWQHHASKKSLSGYMKGLQKDFPDGIVGSEHIWMAAIGPDIQNLGQMKTTHELKQSQIAATALSLLGESSVNFNKTAAKPILSISKYQSSKSKQ
ncbi:sulfatase-like hydrolase/transferase [Shewanella sp. 202IG2-18]|uniref:alkaline phosphatase family protein n=1 Tax=Parashewanella hymeniacidonis TaxID=2807618 RepID=UPI00196138D1|nr:alkaline phosphatase family protein [Parashewanella hymeniacidonis]MBM7070528.1 sulfatase-like hydrolase/transferase [Parashewanella hymeniacidonis]